MTNNKFFNNQFKSKLESLQNKISDLEEIQSDYLLKTKELEKSEDRFRTLLESAPIGIYYSDLYGKFLYGNKKAEELIGFSQDEVIGKSFLKLKMLTPRGTQKAAKLLALNRLGRGTGPDQFTIKRKDGSQRKVEITSRVITLAGKKVAMGLVQDITKRIETERELGAVETRFRELAESITDIFLELNNKLEFIYWNKACEDSTGISSKSAIGKTFQEIFPDLKDTDAEKALLEVLGSRKPKIFENEIKIGKRSFWYEFNAYPTKNGISVIAKEISGKREVKQKLRASIAEKEILLQEIHHRVKNNLQFIASLINIQTFSSSDSVTLKKMKELRHRIDSMSLIHNKLYQSDNLSNIDFGYYIRDLTIHLFRSYEVDTNRVSIHFDIDQIKIELAQAIPCALIINELVTNSLKYAFPNQRHGEITIKLSKEQDQVFRLIIRDDGIGLPKDFNVDKLDSLGIKLVRDLVTQMQGSLTISGEKGTQVVLTFPSR